jgi:hypothetical protein
MSTQVAPAAFSRPVCKYERMTAAQRKAYEQGASGLDNLDRGWIRPIQAKERSATTMKTALKPRKR